MFKKLKKKILKIIYRLLIVQVVLVNKKDIVDILKLRSFSELNINTNKGVFSFKFKEDRRIRIENIKKFFVEIDVPDDVNANLKDLNNKIMIFVKVVLITVDYKIISEVLYEVYLDKAIKYMDRVTTNSAIL